MDTVRVALDWTPNTIHSGLFLAKHKGYYKAEGLEVNLVSPSADEYALTPAKKLALGQADVAIAPSESVISYFIHSEYEKLVAIAAILQQDVSAIVTLSVSGIDSPAQLDNKVYASYNARYEGLILKEMIRNAGGKGEVKEITPPKLGIWDTLITGEADATWVFMPWEGLKAERRGVSLHPFRMDDYQVPYGYSPVLLASYSALSRDKEKLSRFIRATAKGYIEAASNPEEAVDSLQQLSNHPSLQDRDFLLESQRRISSYYLNEKGRFGIMEEQRWERFIDFLFEKGMLEEQAYATMKKETLYTNELLEG
ncbi:ABC transporter substrate-binding protein [Roseivirga sp. BDSF3-8]|uniref:ABC transporter substrate-binding protein n=1 Tax=Roseivirga sp. BDSF3-8 TaxID=3241598 RepID=UPI00353263F3